MATKQQRRVVRANTRLRYRPEQRALEALFDQAREDYKTDRRVASGLAATAIRSARRSRKPLEKLFARSQAAADQAHQDVEVAFGRTGTGADPFKAVTDREFALDQSRRADALRQERTALVKQENQAKLGRLFAMGAARQRYNSTVRQLQEREGDLRSERLDYQVSQLGQLQEEARQRKHAKDIVRMQMGDSGGKGKGKEPFERASRDDRRQFRSDFAEAHSIARKLMKDPTQTWTREEMATALTEGTPSGEGTQGVPKIGDQLAIQSALDMVFGNAVSRKNVRRMRDFGIRIADVPGARTVRQNQRRVAKAKQRAYQERY